MDSNQIVLSIIIPVFNTAQHLKKCLDSILCQKYTSWEALLIDDGSSDGSSEIIEEYSKKDSRFRAYHFPNQGVSITRNFGIEKACGEFITFVDSDDFFNIDMFANQMAKILKSCSDVVQCNYVDFFNGNLITVHGTKKEFVIEKGTDVLKEIFLGNLNSSVCTKVYKKTIIGSTRFSESLSVGEDMLFNIDVCLKAKSIYISNDNAYYYVIHNESVMHSGVSSKRLDVLKAFDILKNRFKDNDVFFQYILIGEIKELITLINASIRTQKPNKELINNLRIKFLCDYKNVKKSLLPVKNRIACIMLKYMPSLYFLILKIKKDKNKI